MRGVAVLAAVLLPCLARAEPTAEVTAWGETVIEREPVNPSTSGNGLGPATPMHGLRYVDHSDQIEAALCRNFGVTVRLSAPPGERLPRSLQVHITHPLFTRPDGATSVEDEFPTAVIGAFANAGFTFDNSWEMQPGDWEIAFYARGAKLAGKLFSVRSPPLGGPRSVCGDVTS